MTDLRIGDAEREEAVSRLGEHYVAGRLTKEEYDERTAAAWAARTSAQLNPLFRDLPTAPKPPAPVVRPRSRGRRHHHHFPVFPLVVLGVMLLVFTPLHVPWWGWLIFAWMWCTGMFAAVARSVGLGRRR